MRRRMNWRNVRWILIREMRDQLRDRRTLFVILILPILLYPLLGTAFFQVSQFMQDRATTVLVIGARNLDDLPPLLENDHFAARLFSDPKKVRLLEVKFLSDEPRPDQGTVADPKAVARAAVINRQCAAAVYFPPDFADRLQVFREAIQERTDRARATGSEDSDGKQSIPLQIPSPEIIYTTANEQSQVTFARLTAVLQRWTDEIVQTNLAATGVPAVAAKPFTVESADIAKRTSLQGAATWSKILPMLLLIWAMTGAFYPAVDLCAGEKERGTLETLLSSPAERSEIVLGKLLTIMFFSMVTAILNLVSMAAMGWFILAKLPGLGPPPVVAALWLSLALVPVSALFSALCLALAALARSSKEGQYYLMPLLLVTMPLAVLPMAPGVELTLGNSLIPVAGLMLLLRAALEGNYWQTLQFTPPVVAVTFGCCYLSIRWAVEQFNSESVLFRESERLDVGLWLRHLLDERKPTPTVAAALFCGILILVIRFFMGLALPQPNDLRGFALVTLISQVVVIALPALMMTIICTSSPRQTLLLRWPPWLTLPAAVLLAVTLHPAMTALQSAITTLYPVNEQLQESLADLQKVIQHGPLVPIILLIALTPAICEELAFRGFILSGFRHTGHKSRAIVFSAIFFGLTHGILQQSMTAMLVGMMIALIAIQSGSILPGMLFHLVHNSLAVAGARIPSVVQQRIPLVTYIVNPAENGHGVEFWTAIGVSALASAALLFWFNRLSYEKSIEEQQQDAIRRALRTEP